MQGTAPEGAQRRVPHPHYPNIKGRTPFSQGVRCGEGGVGDGIVPAVHVNSDDFPMMVGFDPLPDVSLVYLVAQPGRLF